MDRPIVIYAAYILFFFLLVGAIVVVPLLAFSNDMSSVYDAFGYTCHQKLSRSLCIFSDGKDYWVADCTPQGGIFINTYADRASLGVETAQAVGYKMPVCARDFGIYGAMLLAGAAYPFVRRLDERRMYPAIFLILAMVPIGLDGGIQFLSDARLVPFAYESTNTLRLLTGAIAGGAASFYAIPLLVNLFWSRGSMESGQGGTAASQSGLKSGEPEKSAAKKMRRTVPKP